MCLISYLYPAAYRPEWVMAAAIFTNFPQILSPSSDIYRNPQTTVPSWWDNPPPHSPHPSSFVILKEASTQVSRLLVAEQGSLVDTALPRHRDIYLICQFCLPRNQDKIRLDVSTEPPKPILLHLPWLNTSPTQSGWYSSYGFRITKGRWPKPAVENED